MLTKLFAYLIFFLFSLFINVFYGFSHSSAAQMPFSGWIHKRFESEKVRVPKRLVQKYLEYEMSSVPIASVSNDM